MIDKATRYGLRLYNPEKVKINEDANGFMHDSRGKTLSQFYHQEKRYWDGDGIPCVHQSVLDRANNPDNNYHPWILEQYKAGEYNVVPWTHYEKLIENLPHFVTKT